GVQVLGTAGSRGDGTAGVRAVPWTKRRNVGAADRDVGGTIRLLVPAGGAGRVGAEDRAAGGRGTGSAPGDEHEQLQPGAGEPRSAGGAAGSGGHRRRTAGRLTPGGRHNGGFRQLLRLARTRTVRS